MIIFNHFGYSHHNIYFNYLDQFDQFDQIDQFDQFDYLDHFGSRHQSIITDDLCINTIDGGYIVRSILLSPHLYILIFSLYLFSI